MERILTVIELGAGGASIASGASSPANALFERDGEFRSHREEHQTLTPHCPQTDTESTGVVRANANNERKTDFMVYCAEDESRVRRAIY